MTDTPRTDEAIEAYDACGKSRDLVLADFARQLERELDEARAALRGAIGCFNRRRGTTWSWDAIGANGDQLARWRKAAGVET